MTDDLKDRLLAPITIHDPRSVAVVHRDGWKIHDLMNSITCIGKDGVERRFVFDEPEVDDTYDGYRELHFFVKTDSAAAHFFELGLRQRPDGEFQIIFIGHDYHPDYASKGIPDSLLPILALRLGGPVCSSRGRIEGTNEFRTVDATKMWDRLVHKGIARYHRDEDVYRTI